MQYLDLSTEPSIAPLLSMLRQMTRLASSQDILGEFMGQYSRVRPIDAFVGVAPVSNDHAAGYRITYAVRASDAINGRIPHTRDMRPEALAKIDPILPSSSDFFSNLMLDDQPKMVFGIGPLDHPRIASVLQGMTACMVLPIYEGDRVYEWTFAFSRVPHGVIQPRDVGQAVTVANLLGSANRHIDLVAEVKRLNDALNEQIDGIARVQQSLLPNTLPNIPGFQVATSYLTSDAAGGDYFDFFPLPRGQWGVLIADVSGHGPAAATVMAMLHAILHSYPTDELVDPAAVLAFANKRLFDAQLDGSFVTAFFAVVDPSRGTMRFSNCGHNPPRLVRTLTQHPGVESSHPPIISCTPLDHAATIPLGVLHDLLDPSTHEVHLQPGDRLVLYTDGITEAFNDRNIMFGESGLDTSITQCELSADELVESIHKGLFNHHGLRSRVDDQTIVILHYTGPTSSASSVDARQEGDAAGRTSGLTHVVGAA